MNKFSFYINLISAFVWFINLVISLVYFYFTGLNYYAIQAMLAAFLVSSHLTVAYFVRKDKANV